ncbi:M28 family metallopeptidase [Saltatorellus ferox]|uniref:M28 family metallopeptidase n=1 Tax=Saltatorellus ferox TaxID=2528018 RepID=UPI003AF37DA1
MLLTTVGSAGGAASAGRSAPPCTSAIQEELPLGPPVLVNAGVSAAEAVELAIAGRVSDDRAARTVRELVALGARMGGTESGEAAATYLEQAFLGLGLPTERVLAPAKWCHEATDWSVVAHIEGEPDWALVRTWPLGFSPAGAGQKVELSLESTPGKALLAEGFSATPRGEEPCAVVLDSGATTADGEWPMCRPHARRQKARVAVFGISKPDSARLRAALEAGKAVTIDWHLVTTVKEAAPITVVATLAPAPSGDDSGNEWDVSVLPSIGDTTPSTSIGHVLICAHGDSDSGGPGANDNASGVAIVLEMARAWKAAIEAGEIQPPPVEVRFAIWGSEIHSTKAYRDSAFGRGVLAVLNFDQAGYGTTGERLHIEPDDLPATQPYVLLAAEVLRQFADQPGFPKNWATNKSLGGTDSYLFSGWKRFREEQFPSVTMFTSAWGQADEHPRTAGMPGESWRDRESVLMDYDIHYHSSGDTPENTTDKEPHNMGWCARVGLITTLRYLQRMSAEVPREVPSDSPSGGK